MTPAQFYPACPTCGAIPLTNEADPEGLLYTCPDGHSFTAAELNAIAAEPEPGTVKEAEQDFEPAELTAEQAAAWAKKEPAPKFGVVTGPEDVEVDTVLAYHVRPGLVELPPPLKRFAVRLAGQRGLIVEATDETAAKAEYNRQLGIVKSDHPYSILPATEG